MDKFKFDLGKLQTMKVPNLQSTIDYCKLHETLRGEDYRKLSIDHFNTYEGLIKVYNMVVPEFVREFYPLLVKELGMDSNIVSDEAKPFKKIMNKVAEKLKEGIKSNGIEEWKNYCLGCKEPNEGCKEEREKLEKYQTNLETMMQGTIKDSMKAIKTVVEAGTNL